MKTETEYGWIYYAQLLPYYSNIDNFVKNVDDNFLTVQVSEGITRKPSEPLGATNFEYGTISVPISRAGRTVKVGSNNNISVETYKPKKHKEIENKKEDLTNSLPSPTPPIKTPPSTPTIPLSEREKIITLESEVKRLKEQIAQLQNFSSKTTTDVTLLEDDEYLTEIKERSEAYLYEELKRLYPSHQVKWLNYNFATQRFEESYQHHDFEILDNRGNIVHYIDCKATPQQKKTFYLTSNEWNLFLNCIAKGNSYQIYRVYNLETLPKYILIDNLKEWIETGKVVPYLPTTETIKGGRVFLTLV